MTNDLDSLTNNREKLGLLVRRGIVNCEGKTQIEAMVLAKLVTDVPTSAEDYLHAARLFQILSRRFRKDAELRQ